MKTNDKNHHAVLISTGREFRPVVGWDRLYTNRADAEACAARANRNSGWTAKVTSMTIFEAAQLGWIDGLSNDARYWDLCRSYGDTSNEVLAHLESCVAAQTRGENHT